MKKLLLGTAALGATLLLAGKRLEKKDIQAKATAPGNAHRYDPQLQTRREESPLRSKRILCLGSSVTYGTAAQGISFADYLAAIDGAVVTKEAVGSTTLADDFSLMAYLMNGNGGSYVTRLRSVRREPGFDLVIVQLSTNDAMTKKPLGEISQSGCLRDFDVKTVTGAMEYIICYCKDMWNCPVIFYTGCYFENSAYAAMTERLKELQKKWGIGVIDLYTDQPWNDISPELYKLYMYDKIHPTKAGYLKWWLPKMQAALYAMENKEENGQQDLRQ